MSSKVLTGKGNGLRHGCRHISSKEKSQIITRVPIPILIYANSCSCEIKSTLLHIYLSNITTNFRFRG